MRSVLYLAAGAIVTWIFYEPLFGLLTRPMSDVLKAMHSKFLYVSFPEPFMVRMQLSLIGAAILVSPLLTAEIWGFVSPGLTASEKRPLRWITPLAVFLFAGGVSLCYAIMPKAFEWFASYLPKNAELRPTVQQSVLFAAKFLLAFGIAFELPVLLMLLAKVGIIDSKMLKDNWRYSIVIVSTAAAILTPSNDAFSMLCMAIPMAGLYAASIFLVALVEKDRTPITSIPAWFAGLARGMRRKP